MVTTEADQRSGAVLRAHRRRRMSDDIRQVALKLFAKKGFSAVTIEDITAEARVSQRTFFRYFTTKEDVLLDSRTWIDGACEAMAQRPADEPGPQALENALLSLVAAFESEKAMIQQVRTILKRSPELMDKGAGYIISSMDPVVVALSERMGLDPNTDPRPTVIVGASMMAILSAMRVWLFSGSKDGFAAVTAKAFQTFEIQA